MKEYIENIISCPVSCTDFENPMITNCGQTYDEAFLKQYLAAGKTADPLSAEPITFHVPNVLLKSLTELFHIDESSEINTTELTQTEEKKLNELLTCPLSKKTLQDPVVTNHGQTYDRTALKDWMNTNNTSCDPLTQEPITFLIKNFAIVSLLNQYHGIQEITSAIFETIEERIPAEIYTKPLPPLLPVPVAKDMTACILKAIETTLDVYKSLNGSQWHFDIYLRQAIGATEDEFLKFFDDLLAEFGDYIQAEHIVDKLLGFMMYRDFRQWHDTSIQQIFLLIISHRIGLPNLIHEWGAKPKNCQEYMSYCITAIKNKIAQESKYQAPLVETLENSDSDTFIPLENLPSQNQVLERSDDELEKKSAEVIELVHQPRLHSQENQDEEEQNALPTHRTFGDFFFTALAVYENGGGKEQQLAAQNENRPKL